VSYFISISMGKPPVTHIQYSYSVHVHIVFYEQYFINIINILFIIKYYYFYFLFFNLS
jgi:hypothetical protein